MPNHVEHDWNVDGPKEDTEKFIEWLESSLAGTLKDKYVQLAHKVIPYEFYPEWSYGWSNQNWGTKWGIYELKVDYDEREYGSMYYTYQTAWSPGFLIYNALAKKWPTLNMQFCYFERGMMFSGIRKYEKGILVEEDEVKYYGKRGG